MAFAPTISSWILRPQPRPSSPPTIFPTISRHSLQTPQMVLLFCVLDGEPPSKSFPIDIAVDKTVGHLKEFVKDELKPALDGVVVSHLTVYRLPVPVRNTVQLQRALSALDLTADQLKPWDTIASAFPSPAAEGIQVLIRTPDGPTASHYREQIDPWARYRNRLALIKKISPFSPEDYADPQKVITLPFPAVSFFPEDRFEFDDENFRYFGRAKFADLWDIAIQLEKRWGELFFYGTGGYGKSHILAALACLLIRQDKRVVYLPDCRTMLRGFVGYTKEALLLAFGDSPEDQKHVEELDKEDKISNFLRLYSRSEKLYFIIDQLNAFEVDDDGPDRIHSETKRQVSTWLDEFTLHHFRIQSASPNHRTFHHMEKKQTNDRKVTAQGGFSELEMQAWWDRHIDLDLGGYTRDEIEDLTGCVPLLLNSAVADGKRFMISAPELTKVEEQAQGFFDKMCRELMGKRRDLDLYFSMMRACILKRAMESFESKFCDHRYFFVWRPEGRLVGSYVCGIARNAVTKKLRQRHSTNASEAIWLRDLGNFAHNRSMTGFLIEEACLSSITIHGLNIDMELASGITTTWFSSKFPDYSLKPGATLYCPVRCNYPAIDALILRLVASGEKKEAYLFPIQITVAKSHSDSVGKFFASWSDWLRGLEGYKVNVHFCWITSGTLSSSEWKAGKTHPGRGDRDDHVIYPGHTIHQIPLHIVNKDIADCYQAARDFLPLNLPVEEMPEDDALVPNVDSPAGLRGNRDSTADHSGEANGESAAARSAGRGKRKATVRDGKPKKRGRGK